MDRQSSPGCPAGCWLFAGSPGCPARRRSLGCQLSPGAAPPCAAVTACLLLLRGRVATWLDARLGLRSLRLCCAWAWALLVRDGCCPDPDWGRVLLAWALACLCAPLQHKQISDAGHGVAACGLGPCWWGMAAALALAGTTSCRLGRWRARVLPCSVCRLQVQIAEQMYASVLACRLWPC